MSAPHVAVCVPNTGIVTAGFSRDLTILAAHTGHARQVALSFHFGQDSIMAQNVNDVVKSGLDDGATHICWLDADMRFPPDTIDRLLAHRVDFVAANCATKGDVPKSTARHDGNRIEAWPSSGLVEVDGVGLAVSLTTAAVFKDLPYPWLEATWNKDEERWCGYDIGFCEKMKAVGVDLWVDPELSEEVQHTGTKDFGMDDVRKGSAREVAALRA